LNDPEKGEGGKGKAK